ARIRQIRHRSHRPGYVVGLRAKIVKKNSPMTYYVEVEGRVRLAHINQLRKSILTYRITQFNQLKNPSQSYGKSFWHPPLQMS
ncbi:MAG: hypothetical protein MUE72_13280, partial [Chitinophagaceae bacterium]|nr:hypothetical protein [Chitinophagaceae bacterium]